MKAKGCVGAIIISVLFVCACAPQTRFEWGQYEGSLYTYYKSPSERAQYENALVAAIDKGKAEGRLAPGLLAELGYMRMEDGQQDEAKKLFREEMTAFPESRAFLSGVIRRMSEPPMGATS
jgi:hypothetical protein